MRMRVLVTGNNGYIGTILVPMLLKEGHDVVGMDTNLYEQCTFGEAEIPDIPTIAEDIRDVSEADVKGFDAIVHLAALSNDPLGDYSPTLTDSVNHLASVRLARIAKAAGIARFLFASSCSNYGAAGDEFLTEEAAFNPVTPYGRSKVDTEKDLAKLADETFSPVYLRASTAYGVSPRLRFDLVVNNLTAWAYATKVVYLKSDGSPWRPVVHIADIARGYVAALHASRDVIHNQAFNVGSTAENYQVRELAEIVQDVVPGCRVEFAPTAGPDKRCYRVDCNKIAQTLPGYKPQWTARRGVEELYATLCRTGLTLADFEGIRYKRIAHIKNLIRQRRLSDSLYWIDSADRLKAEVA